MRSALFLVLLGLLVLPLRAEDWSTTDGKTYKNVQVLSHNAAYVTILHEDGGGRVPLSTLSPDLQKRFGYDAAKAAAVIAATKVADARDKEALAVEKKKAQMQDAQRQQEAAAILAASLFGPPPDTALFAASAPSPDEVDAASRPIDTEPPTQIDDWGYGDYGPYGGDGYYGYYPSYGYGYGGYGYSYGSGYHNYHSGSRGHSGMHSFSHH
jgi:hypothetical protein